MLLPIDARKAPFRPKYLEDETPMFNGWMIFGTYPDGTVGISDGQDDILTYVPRDKAERIVAARDAFVQAVLTELSL